MGKPTIHVLMVVDMSGSMTDLADDVRGGFNTYVNELRQDKSDKYRFRLTAVKFDTEYMPLCVAAKLADVPTLDTTNYKPRGMTALLDAVGRTINEFESQVPELAEEDRVLLVVQTDGFENSSREFTSKQVTNLVKTREAHGQWSCLFLGAGIDAWTQAEQLGFAQASTVSTQATRAGTRSLYRGLGQSTLSYAAGASGVEAAAAIADEVTKDQ